MALNFDRRDFLAAAAAALPALLSPGPGRAAPAVGNLRLGPTRAFSFQSLASRAERLAAAAYEPPGEPAPDIVSGIDYDAHGKIRFRPEHALYAEGPGSFPVTFFHLGRFFRKPVRMYAVDGAEAAEIRYATAYFDMPEDSVARRLPPGAGFAGFRVHETRGRSDWRTQDWAAFLGASYFRAIGALGQYGISARGLAVDTAAPKPEEFPDFVEFYFEPARAETAPVTVYALLDGPSVSGAYAFRMSRGAGVVMEIEARLFLRRDIERLGIAPLTSMFWYAEQNRRDAQDWRPEVHDSDGLALWTGSGERIWRPLNNPERIVTSSFRDLDPRGFGLLQRDRDFEHYLDGVNYHLRPSLWVEPLDRWGPGAIQLVELPTDDEIHDNIVAFWSPEGQARAGDRLTFRYRLHWLADEPYVPETIGRTVATRTGRGGEPGKPRPSGQVKFVVELAGGPVAGLAPDAAVIAMVTASHGTIVRSFVEVVPGTRRWRLDFDFDPSGPEPAELRAYLQLDGKPLTETWLYQHRPG